MWSIKEVLYLGWNEHYLRAYFAFTASPNMVKEVRNMSPNFKQVA